MRFRRKRYLNTDIKNTIIKVNKEEQYDECAKRLLAHKSILAHILVNTIEEFKGKDVSKVESLIEGEPFVGVVPVDPGMTNKKKTDCIVGLDTEQMEYSEGMIRYDIIFYVRMEDGITKMIINIEAQKDEPLKYDILNRAVFYSCRLISSQKERDFTHSDYNSIQQIYSIWICMNNKENSLCHIHLVKDDLIGYHNWKGNLNLINIIMIGLSDELVDDNETLNIHRILGALFSKHLSIEQRLKIINEEYQIPIQNQIEGDVIAMCNLSEGIKEEGKEEAKTEIIRNMYKKGYSLEQIMDITEMNLEDVHTIIQENEI